MRLVYILCALILILNAYGAINVALANNIDSSSDAVVATDVHIANVVDRIFEKISLFFKFSNRDKIDYQKDLTEKRLVELKYVVENVENGMGDRIEELSSRYSTYLGYLTEMVVKNKMVDKKQEFLDMYETHAKIIEQLITKVDVDSGFWLLLKHDINYVKIYSDQIKSL